MNSLYDFLFVVYPYICLAVFFMGSLARYDRDQYTWKSDSSTLLRKAHMRWASNLFLVLSFDTQAAMADDPAQMAIREVTLSLDVPQVHRSEQPFVRMRDAAIGLAAGMDGLITDDDGDVIRSEALDVIGADLEQLYDMLESRDLAAGSPQARRLFS